MPDIRLICLSDSLRSPRSGTAILRPSVADLEGRHRQRVSGVNKLLLTIHSDIEMTLYVLTQKG